MKSFQFSLFAFLCMTLIGNSCKRATPETAAEPDNVVPSSMNFDNLVLPGATVLAFGPDNVLLVGDSKGATVHAITTEAMEVKDPIPFNLHDLDRTIAGKLGIASRDLIVNDMKIHPVSQEAYVAVRRGHQPEAQSLIVIVRPQDGDVRFLDLSKARHTEAALVNPVTSDFNFWKNVPASSLNITDIDYYDGYVYVAGLTNGAFASTLRKIPYPFNGQQVKVGSIEIYHAVHTQKETRAPIRTMLMEEIEGTPMLIASYTCTPLVSIPLAEIREGNHVKGKTIAELGFGNAPIDMLTFTVQEMDGSYDKKLLITQKQRSGSLISLKDFVAAVKGDGLKGMHMGPAGVNIMPVPTSTVMHIDVQNQMMLTVLRRNMDTGGIDLLSELKGSYFRLSDFIAEYNFPDYQYPETQEMTKQFHDMVKPIEGFPELTSDRRN